MSVIATFVIKGTLQALKTISMNRFIRPIWHTPMRMMGLASPDVPLLLRIMASSVPVSEKAGSIIRDIMKKGELGVVEKGKNDLQTEADRSAQKCIIASLAKLFPGVAIIGEEEQDPNEVVNPEWIVTDEAPEVLAIADKLPAEFKNVKPEEIVIWVDPLDGTSEYTQGLLDHVTVLIGIGVRGKAAAGVVYQPYYNYKAGGDVKIGRAIWGIVGAGVHGFEPGNAPAGKNIICTTRSHGTGTVNEAVEACQPTEVMRVGGCGHKVLLILEGLSNAYVFASPGCKKWDTCAPEAILHAMGGKLTDIHGSTLEYHKEVKARNAGGVLAVPKAKDHDWYLQKIPQTVKDALPA